jgi:hypothetical protein
MDGLIDIPEEGWLRGDTPDGSRIVPWGVQSIGYEDIDFWQGRLVDDIVDTATTALVDEPMYSTTRFLSRRFRKLSQIGRRSSATTSIPMKHRRSPSPTHTTVNC